MLVESLGLQYMEFVNPEQLVILLLCTYWKCPNLLNASEQKFKFKKIFALNFKTADV